MPSTGEIKSWLSPSLCKTEHIDDFEVEIVGNSNKGDGYLGDVVFVKVKAANGKKLDLVLKCSKRSAVTRDKLPIQATFLNEIHSYDPILKLLAKIQIDKGATKHFDSFAKFYGSFVNEELEILILEDLNPRGYQMWNREKTHTRNHHELILGEFGMLHAASVALQAADVLKFQEIASKLVDIWKLFTKSTDMDKMLGGVIDEACDLLNGHVDEDVILRWKSFKQSSDHILNHLFHGDGFKVINHGDGWNNNFLFYSESADPAKPSKVVFLDWQLASYSSPIRDISYYIFSTISKENLADLDNILKYYHDSFSTHLKSLGGNPKKTWPYEQFLKDWRHYCKWGLLTAPLMIKVCLTEKENAIDIVAVNESGSDISEAFTNYKINRDEEFIDRIQGIMEYAVGHNLI